MMPMDAAAKRRVRAGRLLLLGKPPAGVAAAVGAPRQTVYRWLDVRNAEGLDDLRVMSKGFRPAQLDAEQHEELRRILLPDRQASSGFGTELWTVRRVRDAIQRRFAV